MLIEKFQSITKIGESYPEKYNLLNGSYQSTLNHTVLENAFQYSKCLKSKLIWISVRHSITVQFSNSLNFRHCLKSKLKVWFSDTFFKFWSQSLVFRHIRVSEIRTHKSLDFRQFPISAVQISDTYCRSLCWLWNHLLKKYNFYSMAV